MRIFRLAIVGAALLVASNSVFRFAAADEPQVIAAVQQAAVPSGTYQPFSLLQKVRFGATALMNPKAAENAAIVYGFEPHDVLAAGITPEVAKKLDSGGVQIGQAISTGAIVLVKVDEKSIKELVEILRAEAANPNPKSRKWKLLATSATIAGMPASGEWIAWEPETKK